MLLLLLLCCCFSIVTISSCFTGVVNDHLCVTDYWHNITCVLNISGNPEGNLSLRMTHRRRAEAFSCALVPTAKPRYECDCGVKSGDHTLTSIDRYAVQVCDRTGCRTLQDDFLPKFNVRLKPSPQTDVQLWAQDVNITCRSRYQTHQYLLDQLEFQVLLQTPGSTESKTFSLPPPQMSLSVPASRLAASRHCVRSRFRPVRMEVSWSQWGDATCWRSQAAQGTEGSLVLLAKSLGLLCLCAGALLLVFNCPAARMKLKLKCGRGLLTPAPFFKPLFQQHGGNLQEWLSPGGRRVLTFQPEEIQTNVSVVPRAAAKDPKDTRSFFTLTPEVAQLPVAHCWMSYVGVPGPAGPSCDPPAGPGQDPPGQDPPGEDPPGEDPPGEDSPGEDSPGEEPPGQDPPGEDPPGEDPPGQDPPGEDPPGEDPPGEDSPGEDSPGEDPPGEDPPGEDPPGEDPPGEDPPGEDPPGEAVLGGEGPSVPLMCCSDYCVLTKTPEGIVPVLESKGGRKKVPAEE